MSLQSKFGHVSGKVFNINTKEFGFTKINDLYAKNGANYVYPLFGIFINEKGTYGSYPILCTNDTLVALSGSQKEKMQRVIADEDCVKQINAHMAGFQIYEYETAKRPNQKCYNVNLVDADFREQYPVTESADDVAEDNAEELPFN